ncbi:helix-turn-helix domain-containing protein [Nocardia sp. NPDC057227]|uniref:helix-turn-helix domain-containing protein n=1 Tax=Nocardia sp. NPDC057227 TaxID=3346056 RepID=UPI003627F12D
MIEEPRSWRLERNGSTAFVAVCAEFACISLDAAAAPNSYRHPAWQLVLSTDDPVSVTDGRLVTTTAPGVLIPPGLERAIRYPAGFLSLWVDPYLVAVGGVPRVHALDRNQVRGVVTATGRDLDPERLGAALDRLAIAAPAPDPRLRRVLRLLDEGSSVDDAAVRVGLSPRRLRQLAAATLGGSLTALRRWHRLREAVLQFPLRPAAEIAARTGFADQAHLVRTTVAMGGVTPGRMAAVLGGATGLGAREAEK